MNETPDAGHRNDSDLIPNLVTALETLGSDTGGSIAQLRKLGAANRRTIRLLVACFIGLVVALAGVLLVGAKTVSQNSEIGKIQQRTSDKVLCPLYGAFLAAADNPVPDNIKNDPAQLVERQKAFAIIREGYSELRCVERGK